MSSIKTPIGHIIVSNYRSPGSLKDSTLQNSIEDLVTTVKQQVAQNGIAEAFHIVENHLFNIRFDLFDYAERYPDFLSDKSNVLNEAGDKYRSIGTYSRIDTAVADTLGIWQMFGNDIEKTSQNAYQNKDLIESSVRYDFYLMIAELLPDEDLSVKSAELNLLPVYLRNALVDFGSYVALSGIWQPADDDENQLIRNIKIKTAALSLQNGRGQKTSLENLHSLLN